MLLIFESSKDDKASFIVVSLKTLFLFLIKYSTWMELKMKLLTLLGIGVMASCCYRSKRIASEHASHSNFDKIVQKAALHGF